MAEVNLPDYNSRPVNLHRLQAIIDYAGRSVLDAGCGNGIYVLKLADKFNIRGVDWKEFENWKIKPELFSVDDVTKLNYPDDSVDTITSYECLEHLPDPKNVLRNFHRICRKNVIITVPSCDVSQGMRNSLLTYYHYIDPTHVNFFTLDSLVKMCEDAGFQIRVQALINKMDFAPLLNEAYDLSDPIGRMTRWLLRRRQKRTYHLTCMVVAEKV